jgi:predicted ATPase
VLLSERFQATVLPAPAAPVRSRPGRLIEPDNLLIGREDDLAAVTGLLASPGGRLVTLTGAGGVGKSRLAIELARLLADDYPDGVWIVLLESLRDPALVLPAIATVLGAASAAHSEPLAALKQHLSDRRALLVLDNFEQVTAAALDLADLLRSCPGVKVLVTSRSPLFIRGEREHPVLPLAVPDPDAASADELRRSPAVRLFLNRAEAVGASVDLPDDDIRTIARICRRLDGLPLAIELAGSRARLLPPSQLLDRLQRRLPLLTGGLRDAPRRHRTLRAAIDWGHDLLEPDEQVALRRLAVFSGGWTLGAGEEVLTATGPLGTDALTLLESLMLKSFIIRSTIAGPEPRFAFLETFREYARERLEASGDLDAATEAHAAHFLAFAEHAAPETFGPDQATWLDALERDHGNLRQALQGFADRGDVERQLRLSAALGRFWWVHCHFREALNWLRLARERSDGVQDKVRVDVLSWLGIMAWGAGDIDLAEAAHMAALPAHRALGDQHAEHIDMLTLAGVAFVRGDLDTAERRWRELLRLAEARGYTDVQARTHNNLGVVARIRGDLGTARETLEHAIALHEPIDPQSTAVSKGNLAGVLLDLGDLPRARALGTETLRLARQFGDSRTVLEALDTLAAITSAEGRPAGAAWLFAVAEAARERSGIPRTSAEAPLYHRDVRRAREAAAQTGLTVAFDQAWRRGGMATLDDGVVVALGAADDLEIAIAGDVETGSAASTPS